MLSDAAPDIDAPPVTLDLFGDTQPVTPPRVAQVERAMDAVRAKFGRTAIRKGRADK